MASLDRYLSSFQLKNGRTIHYYSLPRLEAEGLVRLDRLPYSIRVLLESLIRYQGRPAFSPHHVEAFARWSPGAENPEEFPFQPARVLLQDFTGVPCIADLAALRSAMQRAGHDPARIEPLIPVDLVIDHSVQVDTYETPESFQINVEKEFERNSERYVFLRWGQSAFKKLRIIPPGLGICHQVNLEYLAQVVMTSVDEAGRTIAFPDTLVGTDSHTTMVNGMGVLGWGVGGIEAEAAMLGQPIPLVSPKVTGVRLIGRLPPGATATDFALAITHLLRKVGVVEQFVEFFGPGVTALTLADRATVANMAPEYGATMGFFPVDAETLRYLRETGRSEEQIELVEAYCRAQKLFRTDDAPVPEFTQVVELDLATLRASVAGPKRPQDRLTLGEVKPSFQKALTAPLKERGYALPPEKLSVSVSADGLGTLRHGSVVVAAITSCTNTSNPHVLLAAGLLAKKAVERGLTVPPYVKTSLAPGSRVVTAYLKKSGLLDALARLRFHVVAYGCTTCIGNSGPLDPRIEKAIREGDIVAAAVLSGNRNFEGRVHPLTKANYLCSPPLVVAYALAGRVDIDLENEPIGNSNDGRPVYLRELWPAEEEIRQYLALAADPETYRELYRDITVSNPLWNKLPGGGSPVYQWDPDSTYIQEPPFLKNLSEVADLSDIRNAAVLALFGDFITTDHISPAGSIPKTSPAGQYLIARGVKPEDFNSYGARRGNHEVMMRGTFANIRIKNEMLGGREGGYTIFHPTGEIMSIYDAAMKYMAAGTPLVVIAGKMYGAGSSRDWAAKGTYLLGVKAVIAESFERIHRSNLVEMGVLPLEFVDGQNASSLGLTGRETISILGLSGGFSPGKRLTVVAESADGKKTFEVKARVDSEVEIDYMRHGGILPFVLRAAMK
ncbi:MAG: aconitate hydratase AcnA [Kiritimatiellae bacterium]|nr:aconitate hydratase AcnA [Kiritimatiellia bacterium]MDW8459111.1 aconitate hydratase AcnA [Verrucomicrobiota bacterium]